MFNLINMLAEIKWEAKANTGSTLKGLGLGIACKGTSTLTRAYNPGIHDREERGGWGSFWVYSGGTLADDASHVLDLARWC